MRLTAYFILVYLVIGLQIGMGDFVRIGLPLNLVTWLAASLIIPFFFPLH